MADYEREGHAQPAAPDRPWLSGGVGPDTGREVVADVWRAHRDAQRLHLRSIRPRQKTGLQTRRCSVEAQGRIAEEKSGLAIPHLEPIMKLLLFHRPNAMGESLFSSEKVSLASIRPSRWYSHRAGSKESLREPRVSRCVGRGESCPGGWHYLRHPSAKRIYEHLHAHWSPLTSAPRHRANSSAHGMSAPDLFV